MSVKGALLLVGCLFLVGCASGGFPPQTATETMKIPAGSRIEISLAPETFEVDEIEFHVTKGKLPPFIMKQASEVMGEGEIGECEIEYHDGMVFYEVTGIVKGLEQEVMFTADGQVHGWEVEVPASEVPPLVMKQAEAALKGATLKKSEQILDGLQNPVEYHFKMEKEGVKYKVVVPLTEGGVQIYRETLAEIEVPVQ